MHQDNEFKMSAKSINACGLDLVDVTIQASLDEKWQVDERIEALKGYLKEYGFTHMWDEDFTH